MNPFWITFYSYKGGVGRSLAIANIAALLVKRGRRVVLIDFDLEAPGLDTFSEFRSATGKPGVLEYVSQFLRDEAAPDITQFIHPCELSERLRGQLWIMPAGRRDANYNHQLTRIDWSGLYEKELGRPFFENWKAAINHKFQPDFVLIDSRTGLTEIGGVCTTQFPDLVVMLFGLNEQNVCGTEKVAENIRAADPSRVPQIHYVATPVPNMTPDKRSALTIRLQNAAKHLGVEIKSMVRYYAPAALSEKLFVLSDTTPTPQIKTDYDGLLESLVEFNRRGLDFLLAEFKSAVATSDTNRIDRLRKVIERDYGQRAEGRYLLSQIASRKGDTKLSVRLADESSSLDPAYEPPFKFLSAHYTRARKPAAVVELCDRILKHSDSLSSNFLYQVHLDRGEKAMAAGEPAKAAASYRWCQNHVKDLPAEMRLVPSFNAAESHRRKTKTVERQEWEKVLDLFNQTAKGAYTLPIQANRAQAMHVAYACTGDREGALEMLRNARRAADSVGEVEDVFSLKVYSPVPVVEFRKTNDEMMAAIQRGELWDGMKLPPSND